jgi:2-hydroxy-3-keto-5-methylthiopentenyl-1-phosphate phosphatase
VSCFSNRLQTERESFRLIHTSHFGHDKSIEIRQYSKLPDSQRPIMFYAGDGVSDLSAAKETDLLFAKKGHGKASLNPPKELEKLVLTTL